MCSVCFRYWHLQNLYTQTICRVHPQDTLCVWQGSVCQEGVRASVIAASCLWVLPGPRVQQLDARGVPLGQPEVSRVQDVPPGPFQQKPIPAEETHVTGQHWAGSPRCAVLCCTVSQESNLGDVGTLISHDRARTVAGGQERHQEVFLLGSADKEDQHPTKRRQTDWSLTSDSDVWRRMVTFSFHFIR